MVATAKDSGSRGTRGCDDDGNFTQALTLCRSDEHNTRQSRHRTDKDMRQLLVFVFYTAAEPMILVRDD